ncbi:Na+/H+ antiporter subunit A [Brachybacterium huguangmaarense]
MILLLIAHLAAAIAAPFLVRAIGRNAFYPLALVPAAGAVWTATQGPMALQDSPRVESVPWMPVYGVELSFRLDVLSWVLLLIVTGIGALVLAYCARYFKDSEPGLGRFAGVLVAFAGAMAGLVAADDVMVMFVFWELTTVFSYLLIGHYQDKRASRRAAMNALISTTAGGLAMMIGLLMLAVRAGSMSLRAIVDDPMWAHGDAFLVTAMVLVVAGAASKSALVPTHFWLPGAMAAPTPVSAYLHAAAMVKAGIYLILRFAPAIHALPSVSTLLAVLGAATMIVGGWRALRQVDIKLLLAYGTVSQLGFMAAIAGIANEGAVLAALALLISHALFKAPLFMVVGIIDKRFGTRDMHELSGVLRAAPVVGVIGIVSAASMAGIPPLLGFVSKEAVLTALWYGSALDRAVLAALVLGSVLTVAYAWRFVAGAFGPGERTRPRPAHPAAATALAWMPPAVIAVGTLALPLLTHRLEELLGLYAATVPATGGSDHVHLAAIPPLGVPLALSVLAILLGAGLAVAAGPVERFQRAVSPAAWRDGALVDTVDAEHVFRRMMRGLDALAVRVIALFQRGSLPYTLGTMLIVLIALITPVLVGTSAVPDNLVLWFHPVEALVMVVAATAAIAAARSRRRMRGVLLISVTGFMVATLFMLWGAADVATTQVLVESMLTIVLVLVLRRLPVHFSKRPIKLDNWLRWAIAIGTAGALCGAAVYAAGARVADPLGPTLIEPAYTRGGGHNVVNVILVDARVWDTYGEISVLLAVATGVASLIFITQRERRFSRVADLDDGQAIWRTPETAHVPDNVLQFDGHPEDEQATGNRWRTWLSAGRTLAPERRMVILEVITRLAFPLLMMFSIYLLMAGHNLPGGGFAGGLVAGLALTLRYLAGGRYELVEAAPVHAGFVLGAGLFVSSLAALAPLAFGGAIFQTVTLVEHLPILGETHLASALLFDVGVYLIVVGVALDFLRSLGAQIDLQQEAELDAG